MYPTKTKKELLTDICKSLRDHGLRGMDDLGFEEEYTLESHLACQLNFLPVENLQKIASCEVTDWSDIGKVLDCWGRCGGLRFDPYIVDTENNPTLVIRYNRYLHMFRGYHFQVSGTCAGSGTCEQGSYRTDFLLNHRDALWENSALVNMLCYAAAIDAAYVFDNFRAWVKKSPDEFDSFIHMSFEYWRMKLTYKWEDILKYIHVESDWSNTDRQIYKITCSKGILCEFAYGVNTIQVRTAEIGKPARILTLDVPDVDDGIKDIGDYELEDIVDFRTKVLYGGKTDKRERVDVKMLLIMMLALSGVRINWNASYLIEKMSIIKGTNVPGVVEVNSLNDIADRKLDLF